MSRALANLIEHADLIEAMFKELVDRLRQLVPELGRHLGFDGKAIPTFSTGRKNRETGETTDPEADWGMKKYRGEDADGKPWEKLTRWFGYQLHLICDTTLEIPVAFEVLPASTSEVTRLLPMVEKLATQHPELMDRCVDLSADRGLDSGGVNKALWEEHQIKPASTRSSASSTTLSAASPRCGSKSASPSPSCSPSRSARSQRRNPS